VGVVVVLSPHARRAAREARAAEIAAQRRRSRAAHPTARATRGQARRSTGAALPGGTPATATPPAPAAPRAAGAGQGLR
jgi:UDP-GlcNAc:undecaprenyl-phosphate GlcNAc-1-phosphate transferase